MLPRRLVYSWQLRLANIHCLACVRGNLLADYQTPNALALPSRRSPPERVCTLLCNALVRFDKVAQHLGAGRSDDACVDVRTRAEIVEDTS